MLTSEPLTVQPIHMHIADMRLLRHPSVLCAALVCQALTMQNTTSALIAQSSSSLSPCSLDAREHLVYRLCLPAD
jgi:hypothetical protein